MSLDYADDPRRGCAPGKTDPEIFFAERGTPEIVKARETCRNCPFTTECLQDALDTGEEHGIRGGINMGSLIERGIAQRGEQTTRDHVRNLWEHGLNDAVIGRQLGINPRTVREHRLRLGLPAQATGRPRKTAVAA